MKIWTFQSKEAAKAIESLKDGDFYICEAIKAACMTYAKETFPAYDWMARKVSVKCGFTKTEEEHPASLPIWGWYMYHGKNECPETYDGSFNTERNNVCIELEVPEQLVVLSDINLWYEPLADRPCLAGLPKEEKDSFQKSFEEASTNEEKVALHEKTWERVLELHPEKYPFFNEEAVPFPLTEYYDVQAAFPFIAKPFVKNIDYGFAKRAPSPAKVFRKEQKYAAEYLRKNHKE